MITAPLLAIVALHWTVMVTPGPNSALVVHVAATRGFHAATRVSLGIALGAALMAGLALLGAGALIAQNPALLTAMKGLGGVYLIFLAIRLLRSRPGPLVSSRPDLVANDVWQGVVNNLGNPNSLLFFGSVFTTLLPNPVPTQLGVVAVTVIFLDAVVWYVLLAAIFSQPRIQRWNSTTGLYLTRLSGLLLLVFGFGLLLSLW